MICDDTSLQPRLPQIFVGNEHFFAKGHGKDPTSRRQEHPSVEEEERLGDEKHDGGGGASLGCGTWCGAGTETRHASARRMQNPHGQRISARLCGAMNSGALRAGIAHLAVAAIGHTRVQQI